MSEILGYGEDAFTLWALKHHTSDILEHPKFQDKTAPLDCLIFYRPSFGRSGGEKSAEFGEFDAILVSSENIYLIESKWDNLTKFKKDELAINKEQILRHQIFSWYLTHWNRKYYNNWVNFVKEQDSDFQKEFKKYKKTMAPSDSLLATNLEFILNKLLEHCKKFSSNNIKNVLLFFYNEKKSTPPKVRRIFTLIPIDYSKETRGNFVTLYP